MNCIPGDLAIVTKGAKSSGRVVRCIRLLEGWVLFKDTAGGMRWVAAASDKTLLPIRDPGDDAVDETLHWLPVPYKEHA